MTVTDPGLLPAVISPPAMRQAEDLAIDAQAAIRSIVETVRPWLQADHGLAERANYRHAQLNGLTGGLRATVEKCQRAGERAQELTATIIDADEELHNLRRWLGDAVSKLAELPEEGDAEEEMARIRADAQQAARVAEVAQEAIADRLAELETISRDLERITKHLPPPTVSDTAHRTIDAINQVHSGVGQFITVLRNARRVG